MTIDLSERGRGHGWGYIHQGNYNHGSFNLDFDTNCVALTNVGVGEDSRFNMFNTLSGSSLMIIACL